MRILLHAMFILVVFSLEALFKSLYIKEYHFEFKYQFGPMALLFYSFYLCYIYCIAFIVLSAGAGLRRNLRIPFRVALAVCTYFSFIPVRYLVEQILLYRLTGLSNYSQAVTWDYYFRDNLGISFIALMAGVFVKFMDDWFVADRQKSVLERENLRLELDFLKSQLNPHFLFNTLNNIQSYIVQDEKKKSIELIARLSEYMRFALYECNEEFIALDKEISILQDYVELERVRCDDRTTIAFHADGNFAGYCIPPMLLMPFVENAFKHGANGQLGNSWIHVAIRQQNGVLDLKVENDFIQPEGLLEAVDARDIRNGGIGLQNVRRRLQYYFNNSHRLTSVAENRVYKVNLTIALK